MRDASPSKMFVSSFASCLFLTKMKINTTSVYSAVILFGILCLLSDMFMWYVVHNYYETLKLMKRFTEEAVVSIPCPSVKHMTLLMQININLNNDVSFTSMHSGTN